MRKWRTTSELLLAMRVAVWLCMLPVRLRRRSLPLLLDAATATDRRFRHNATSFEAAVRIARRLSSLPVFTPPVFPKACLRQALAECYALSCLGCALEFCIGVRKDGRRLVAHSWAALNGKPINPGEDVRLLQLVYVYKRSSVSSV